MGTSVTTFFFEKPDEFILLQKFYKIFLCEQKLSAEAAPAVKDCETFGIGYCQDIKKLTTFEHSLFKKIKNEDLIDLVKDLKIESNLAQKASALLETVSPFYISFLILSLSYFNII